MVVVGLCCLLYCFVFVVGFCVGCDDGVVFVLVFWLWCNDIVVDDVVLGVVVCVVGFVVCFGEYFGWGVLVLVLVFFVVGVCWCYFVVVVFVVFVVEGIVVLVWCGDG